MSFFEHVKKSAICTNVNGFVFDWDRTLQVMEGMFKGLKISHYMAILQSSRVETIEAISEFHAGGKMRLEELRQMFTVINKEKKPVFIISANETIESDSEIYRSILNNWGCNTLQEMYYSKSKYKTMKLLQSMNKYCN